MLEEGVLPQGDAPQKLADDILMAILRDDKEHMELGFKFSHWLSVTWPWIFHLMMAERAKKMTQNPANSDQNPNPNQQRF